MEKSGKSPLPKYASPPVVETLLGVEFQRLEKWSVPHFGLFWEKISKQFPKFATKRALDSQLEVLGRPSTTPEPQQHLVLEVPDVRCWYISEDDRSLIQLQPNRFVFNWRKRGLEDGYPQYEASIRPQFMDAWKAFVDFLGEQDLNAPEVLQCEVSYVNHIDKGHGWQSTSDLKDVFPCWAGRSQGTFLPEPEIVFFEVAYRIPDDLGRLRISVKPAIRNADGAEIIHVTVSSRAKPVASSFEHLMGCMDLGREWVVRGFTDFTSAAMHSMWERTQ